jgi:tetratricopeptide (TPR) repeat protein
VSTVKEITDRYWVAKKILMFKKDRAQAHAIALEALAMMPEADATGSALGTLYHNLSAVFRDLEDLERCEPLARRAVELEAGGNATPYLLGDYDGFLAELLRDMGKPVEAAEAARASIATYQRDPSQNDPELRYKCELAQKIIDGK